MSMSTSPKDRERAEVSGRFVDARRVERLTGREQQLSFESTYRRVLACTALTSPNPQNRRTSLESNTSVRSMTIDRMMGARVAEPAGGLV